MKKNEFLNKVVEELKERFGTKATIEINTVIKNNDITLNGIVIREEKMNIYPNIYIDGYYEKAQKADNYNIGMVCDKIIRTYNETKIDCKMDADFFDEFDNVKDEIVMKLVNFDKNKKYLAKHAHKKVFDLAIVFYYIFKSDKMGQASMFIQNRHCEMWDISIEQLYDVAFKNTFEKFPTYIEDMEKKIIGILGEESAAIFETEEEVEEKKSFMYVMGNSNDLNGAISIMDKQMLMKFAEEIGDNFFILPSSIHELILVPSTDSSDSARYLELVRSTNESCVDEEDFLSDNIYFYNGWENEIECISS